MATIYSAQFARPQGTDVYSDPFHAGTLVVTTSMKPREDANPSDGPLPEPPETGLELRISRVVPDDPDPTKPPAPVFVNCTLSALNLPLPSMFTMTLHGRIESLSPCAFPSLWAPAVGVQGSNKFVGATHQVRNPLRGPPFPSNPLRPTGFQQPDPPGVHLALGAGQPDAGSVMPPVTDELFTPNDAYPNWMEGWVELQTDIDTASRRGRSRLMTRDHTWMERSWTFNSFPPITDVGFGLTITNGFGTAKATILDFSISG